MYLNLKTDKPILLALWGMSCAAAVCAWAMTVDASAVGGSGSSSAGSHAIEERLRDLRSEQLVRSRREEILRAQLSAIDDAEELTDDLRATRDELLELLLDRRRAEDEIAASLRELWDAQGYAQRASRASHGRERVSFAWPVEPALGISAHFDDPGYRARFGFPHKAIDIPVNQGSTVYSVADGVVEKISDQGMGFNSIVIRHDGGYATLYGHVTEFLVEEGEEVAKGDAIAKSGGMPGTKGAGRMTTGPHLHLEMFKDGDAIDPLPLLPARDEVR
jgi:murein DD-endopeptidase MepM/ murein hydrolase activator NlpD